MAPNAVPPPPTPLSDDADTGAPKPSPLAYQAADPGLRPQKPFACAVPCLFLGVVLALADLLPYMPLGVRKVARFAAQPSLPLVMDSIDVGKWTNEVAFITVVVQWTVFGLFIDGLRQWSRVR